MASLTMTTTMNDKPSSKTLPMPKRPITFVPAKAGEILRIGDITCRVMEDGSNTENRFGSVEFIVPPDTQGPLAHWHEMHDETFLVTAGQVRFHASGGKTVDAKTGDYVIVPTRAPHAFSNPWGEEARFFNTFTPAHYINYFKLLAAKRELSQEMQLEAMSRYATMPANHMHVG